MKGLGALWRMVRGASRRRGARVQALLRQGQGLVAEGRAAEAAQALRRAADKVPDSPEILRGADRSRLLLANPALKSPHNRNYVEARFEERGVAPGRLTLRGPADHMEFLRYYDSIDVALDAFPYNGGTTTMEAIWQGVPVLTFDGDRWASRTSQSLLRNSHLAEYVTADARAYVRTC